MKVRAVLEVIEVQHKRAHGGAQTRVVMVGGGIAPLRLSWTIPEWTAITKGMTFEVDISPVLGGVGEEHAP